MKTRALVSLIACITLPTQLSFAEDIAFFEGDFEPGSWSAFSPFWSGLPDHGEQMNVTSDRFIGGNPANAFMVTQYMLDFPNPTFNVAHAPIMMNAFTYNPSVDGAIEEIAGSMHTMPVSGTGGFAYVLPRMYIVQDGRVYTSWHSENWGGFLGDDAAQIRNFDSYTADDFFEIELNVGLNLDSHPDFAGSAMQFGFGVQLTSTNLQDVGSLTRVLGFDDVSVRLNTVPAPGGLALLGLAGLATRRRQRL